MVITRKPPLAGPRWRSVEESDIKLQVPSCRSFPAEVSQHGATLKTLPSLAVAIPRRSSHQAVFHVVGRRLGKREARAEIVASDNVTVVDLGLRQPIAGPAEHFFNARYCSI